MKQELEVKVTAIRDELCTFAQLLEDKHRVEIKVAPMSFSSGNKLTLRISMKKE